jgi:hypothetical protein
MRKTPFEYFGYFFGGGGITSGGSSRVFKNLYSASF